MKKWLELAFEIGLQPREFYRLTPVEFLACVKGYLKRRKYEFQLSVFTRTGKWPELDEGEKKEDEEKIVRRLKDLKAREARKEK